jgi:tetratricopeptide (TPR) repeat protein
MNSIRGYLWLVLAGVNLACASFQVGGEVNAGRQAFLVGNYDTTLVYFQSAAAKDPNYIYGTALREGIWSYVGRAEYANSRLPQAKQALERALAANPDEPIARLYLGLTIARSGDRQLSLKEIEAGLQGIFTWLEYVTQTFRFSFGQYWDPTGAIRAAIRRELETLASREFDWPTLIADCEWIGKQIEAEGDRARSDESRQWNREGGDGRGGRR